MTALLMTLSVVMSQSPKDTGTVDTLITIKEMVVTANRGAAESERFELSTALSFVKPEVADISRGIVAADLLRDVAGVHVQQTSAGQGAVILRGLVGNQVLLLVNGIPLNNGTYRDGPGQYLATIDPETIERIEVIRGPASVLYGSDAQGGVVNVITRSHPFVGLRSVRFSGHATSANSGVRGRFSTGWVGTKWSFAFGGALSNAGDLRAGGGLGRQDPTGFSTGGLDAEVAYDDNDKHSLRAVVQHFEMDDVPRYDRYVNFRATNPELGRDAEHVFDPQTRQLAFTRYTFKPRTNLVRQIEATASLNIQREGRTRIRLLDSGEPDSMQTRWRDDVYTPGFSVVGTSGFLFGTRALALTWGADFYHDELNSSGVRENLNSAAPGVALFRQTASGTIPSGRFPDGAKADRAGIFLSGETQVVQRLTVSAGLRWSWFRNEANVGTNLGGFVENTSSDLTGQLGIVYAPAREWRLAFRLAEGFRAPNLYDLTNVGPVPGGIAVPNPDAIPERSLSTELGIRYSGMRGAFDLTFYRTEIDDFIDRTIGGFQGDTLFQGERVFQGRNVGTARVVGVEGEGIVRFGQFEARGTLLYSRGEQEDPSGVEEPMSKIPPLGGNATLRWTSDDNRFWIEYAFRWATEQDRLGSRDLRDNRIPDGGTPGYAVQGIGATATIVPRRLTLSAGVGNLTDELYRTHASGVDAAGRHVWVGMTAVGVL